VSCIAGLERISHALNCRRQPLAATHLCRRGLWRTQHDGPNVGGSASALVRISQRMLISPSGGAPCMGRNTCRGTWPPGGVGGTQPFVQFILRASACRFSTSLGFQARTMHQSVGRLQRSLPFSPQRNRTTVGLRTKAVLAPADPKPPQPSRPSPAAPRGLSAALISVFRGGQRTTDAENAALSSLEEATTRRAQEVSILSNASPPALVPPTPLHTSPYSAPRNLLRIDTRNAAAGAGA
jgi:hypothetical protein